MLRLSKRLEIAVPVLPKPSVPELCFMSVASLVAALFAVFAFGLI